MRPKGTWRTLTLVGALALATGVGTLAPIDPVAAQESLRADAIRRANELFERMRGRVWTGRMTGCGGWECNDATLSMKLPGKIRIEYDYNSSVVSDGDDLVTYRGPDEIDRRPLAETQLSLLLAGELGRDVRVDAVEVIDRGRSFRRHRYIVQMEVANADGRRLTLYFSKKPFEFLGWHAPGRRGGFHASVRDLRPTERSVDFGVPAPPGS